MYMSFGAGGLYAGFLPNLVRNTIISSSEIVTYDVSKTAYKDLGVPDGPVLHMLSGVSAGLVATTLGSPMDVVSTRIMVNKQRGYTAGMVETCQQMLLKEGPTSFYQGVQPPHNTLLVSLAVRSELELVTSS